MNANITIQELRLSYNHLFGALPPEWSTLTSLTSLFLNSDWGIFGTIPYEYSQLASSLNEVDLVNTGLCGAYPTGGCGRVCGVYPSIPVRQHDLREIAACCLSTWLLSH